MDTAGKAWSKGAALRGKEHLPKTATLGPQLSRELRYQLIGSLAVPKIVLGHRPDLLFKAPSRLNTMPGSASLPSAPTPSTEEK